VAVYRCGDAPMSTWYGALVTLLLAAGSISIVGCGAADSDDTSRQHAYLSEKAAPEDSVAALIQRQRELFVRLARRQDIAEFAIDRFSVRNRVSGPGEDSIADAVLRHARVLASLNARLPLDSAGVAMIGDVARYTEFQSYPLSLDQTIVVAVREDGVAVMTNWLRDGGEWRALDILINPSDHMLSIMKERSVQYVRS
jgi:hypothetical protein